MEFEFLGAGGAAQENECGHWLLPDDDVASSVKDNPFKSALPALRGFPRNWPEVFKESPSLRKFINKRLKGTRCRAVSPPDGSDHTMVRKVICHPFHSFRNAQRVSARCGWAVVHGFRIFEAFDAADGYVAIRHAWNATPSGTWVDMTPGPLPSVYVPGAEAEQRVLLVESSLGDKEAVPLSSSTRRDALCVISSLARALTDGLVGCDGEVARVAGDAALAAGDLDAASAFYKAGAQLVAKPSNTAHDDGATAAPRSCVGLDVLLGVHVTAASMASAAVGKDSTGGDLPSDEVGDLALALACGSVACHIERMDWWEAALMADETLLHKPAGHPKICEMQVYYAEAAAHLGLLSLAHDLGVQAERSTQRRVAQEAAAASLSASERGIAKRLVAVADLVARRLSAIERGALGALDAEIRFLSDALGEGAARKWVTSVEAEMVTPAGRRRLAQSGFLTTEDVDRDRDSELAVSHRKAIHKTLTYHVKKRLQQNQTLRQASSADADGTTGGTYRCVAPRVVANALGARPLLNAASLRSLATDRMVVADGVLDADWIAGAGKEMSDLYRGGIGGGILQTDTDDVCNPLQHSFDFSLYDDTVAKHVKRDCPCLAQCVAHLFNLPLCVYRILTRAPRPTHA